MGTHPHAVGQEAARLALRRIKNPNGAREQVVLSPQLRVRESCGAPVRRDEVLLPAS
ncbi:hypothetical protein [Halomonas jincaotanensis]|uniref:hypothetical protein n=1 Tax=Halomonas jincaotanensis TaxID=2810616 RepID=UPI0029E81C33|nr:hypothetical protein [Halomonas jincaotanensis]